MPVTYTNIPINVDYADLKHVIGKSGRHLHALKDSYNMNKIWYNPRRHIFHIWGDGERLSYCRMALVAHLEHCIKKYRIRVTDWSDASDIHSFVEFDPARISKEFVPAVIGYNGRNFKAITELSGASFVWYDSVRHGIHVWGDSKATDNIFRHYNQPSSSSSTDD